MKKLFVIAMLSIAAAPAVAADMYAGIKAGTALHWIDATRFQESVRAAGIFIGYTVNPNMAVEAEAVNLGSVDYTAAKVGALGVAVLGTHHANEQISLFAKLGLASTKEDVSGTIANHTGVSLGAGGQYDINQTVGVRLAWEYYRYGGDSGLSLASASLYSIAALYKF